MKIVQLGSNKGNDDLSAFIKKSSYDIEFALFVEANSLHINDLKECYKNYSNIFIENIAIKLPSYEKNELEIFYSAYDAPEYKIASCDINHIYKHIEMCPQLIGGEIKSFTVPCISIDDLFKKYNIKDLDWLLIDLEGIDGEILLSTDWEKYNIKKIEFEHLHLGDENKIKIREMLKNSGYVRTYALHKFDEAWIKKSEVSEMEVTLYAIAKNEEKNIDKFIKNSEKFTHTVVVDTGSTDNTVKLLKEAGIEVYEHPQTREEFDFSVARNQALSYVKTDWAFSLDFNEDVDDFFSEGLDVISGEFTAFKHERYDKHGDNDPVQSNEVHVRFHRTKNYKWSNSVHEIPKFIPSEEYPTESVVDTTVKITKNVLNTIDKQLFYLSICEREYKKDSTNWYYNWFIFNHYFDVQNYERALQYGQEFLNNTDAYFNSFRVDAFIKCGICLVNLNDIQRASNYAFHALSESMNMGTSLEMGKAFTFLLNIGKMINNPNIIIFASGFSEETLNLEERKKAITELYNMIQNEN